MQNMQIRWILKLLALSILSVYKVCALESCSTLTRALNSTLSKRNVTSYPLEKLENVVDLKSCSCEKSCVRKCCAQGYYLREEGKLCILDENNTEYFSNFLKEEEISGKIDLTVGIECLENYYQGPSSNPDDGFMIWDNGSMYVPSYNDVIPSEEYCVDYLENKGIWGMICFPVFEDAMETVNNSGMIISMPFLLVTFIVYALLPDRNLPAKALMCYVLSLLFAYILLVTIQLDSGHESTTCITLAFFCYFFFMASFFWMNASCLDIFFTFSGIRGLLGEKKKENKRFLYYSGYAWGVPILMVGFASIFTFGEIDETSRFYTGLGNGQCWFKGVWATGIYFYFPIAILLIVNIVLFGITTYKIKSVQRDTKMLKNVDSRKHKKYDSNDQQRFNLYVKLLFAMGINWAMEVISWAIMCKWSNVPDYVWVLTDFCNAVYGVFIFFIFVFKRNIWMLLKKRYLQLTGRPQQAHTLTSTHRTTVTASIQSLSKSLERKITPTCLRYDESEKNLESKI